MARARNLFRSGRGGDAFRSIEELEEAAAELPGLDLTDEERRSRVLQLRRDVIACESRADPRPGPSLPLRDGEKFLAFSADVMLYAVATPDEAVVVRRTDGQKDVARLGPAAAPIFARFGPRKRFLGVIQGVHQHGLRLFRLDTAELTLEISTGVSDKNAVDFSPSGRELAVGFEDGSLHLYDAASGAALSPDAPLRPGRAYMVRFHPEGDRVAISFATYRAGAEVHVLDRHTGRLLKPLGHEAEVRGVAWHPAGHLLAAALATGEVWVWDVDRRTVERRLARSLYRGPGRDLQPRGRPSRLHLVGLDVARLGSRFRSAPRGRSSPVRDSFHHDVPCG